MIYPYEFILIRWKTFYSSTSKIFDTITLYFVHFFEFIKRRTKIFTIDTEIDTDEIKVLLDENPYFTARDIADDLQISYPNVLNHIHKIGYVSRLGCRTPWPRSNWGVGPRYTIHWFLKSLVTGDEKRIIHNNLKRKRSWEILLIN